MYQSHKLLSVYYSIIILTHSHFNTRKFPTKSSNFLYCVYCYYQRTMMITKEPKLTKTLDILYVMHNNIITMMSLEYSFKANNNGKKSKKKKELVRMRGNFTLLLFIVITLKLPLRYKTVITTTTSSEGIKL